MTDVIDVKSGRSGQDSAGQDSAGETSGGGASGDTEALLPIGKVAEQVGVSERTLRYYEEIGLLTPAGHSPGRCRRYTQAEVARVNHIRELQEVMGYNLEEIATILGARDRLERVAEECRSGQDRARQAQLVDEALATLEESRARVRAKADRLQRILAQVDEAWDRYQGAAEELRSLRSRA